MSSQNAATSSSTAPSRPTILIPGQIVATRTPRDLHANAIRRQLQDALKEMCKAADGDERVAYANEAVDFGVSTSLF